MKPILMKALLFLGIASLTATPTTQEKHAQTHSIFTFYRGLKPHHFNLDLDCEVNPLTTHPAALILSCTLESTLRVPDGTYDPAEFPIEFKSEAPTIFREGHMVPPISLHPFTLPNPPFPYGDKRVAIKAGCVQTLLGWDNRRLAEAEIWCEILTAKSVDGKCEYLVDSSGRPAGCKKY
ncbi:hypothetical protein EAF04_001795 [Stromatinia cepivora]|nr:hypothetical protein EAF04_001795 [Stromatinia cepivora]